MFLKLVQIQTVYTAFVNNFFCIKKYCNFGHSIEFWMVGIMLSKRSRRKIAQIEYFAADFMSKQGILQK